MKRILQTTINRIYNCLLLKKHKVTTGKNLIINGRLGINGTGRITIGDNVIINSSLPHNPTAGGTRTYFTVHENAELIIGDNVGISNSSITAKKSVKIGSDALIGANCMIADNDFHSIEYENRMKSPDTHVGCSPVIISNGAFIGARTIVLKGVVIGEKAVLGAGSVATKPVPANQIWAGNPAKYIRDI